MSSSGQRRSKKNIDYIKNLFYKLKIYIVNQNKTFLLKKILQGKQFSKEILY